MANKKPSIKTTTSTHKGRKRDAILVYVIINNKEEFVVWFKKGGGVKSYGYFNYEGKATWKWYSGKKNMMRSFLKDFKEKYESMV